MNPPKEVVLQLVLTRWCYRNSDESQHWRYTPPPLARDGDLWIQHLYGEPPVPNSSPASPNP